MKLIHVVLLLFVALTMVGCASSQSKANKGQAQIHEERLNLIDKYQKCLEEAGEDKTRVEACDQYLKAAEALK